jgi:polyisoprenoid-binding protein YceI
MRFLFAFFFLVSAAAHAKTVRFDFRDVGSRNLVYFISEGPLQKTLGSSHALSGWLELDPEKVNDGIRGQWEVDVRTFDTRLDAINAGVRASSGTGENPLANFVVTRLTSASRTSLLEGQPCTVRVEGNLTLKGVTKVQTVLVKLTYFRESVDTRQRLPGNLLRFSSSFDQDLNDFNISVPEEQRMQFSRFLQVFADGSGTDKPPVSMLATVPPGLPAPETSKK